MPVASALVQTLRCCQRSLLPLLVGCALHLPAAPLRIAAWNLESLTNTIDQAATPEARINSTAFALRRLKPDVVLLQEVPDWKTASAIASRIDPKFSVRICSAYGGEGPQRSRRQMAVLSSFTAAVSWHEGWTGTGELGYAITLLEIGGRRVGFASLVLPDGANTNQSAARLLAAGQFFAKLAEIRAWKTNGPTAVLLGGTFGSGDEVSDVVLHRARAEGFTSAFLNLSRDARATRRARNQRPAAITDYLYAEGGGYVAPVQLLPNIVSDHAIQMVDWDLERTMPVIMVSEPALAANAPDAPPGNPSVESLATAAGSNLFGIDLKWWVLGLGGTVLLLVIAMFRRPAQPRVDGRRAPAGSPPPAELVEGSVHWRPAAAAQRNDECPRHRRPPGRRTRQTDGANPGQPDQPNPQGRRSRRGFGTGAGRGEVGESGIDQGQPAPRPARTRRSAGQGCRARRTSGLSGRTLNVQLSTRNSQRGIARAWRDASAVLLLQVECRAFGVAGFLPLTSPFPNRPRPCPCSRRSRNTPWCNQFSAPRHRSAPSENRRRNT